MLLDMHFDTQFYGSVVGDVTKTKKVAQSKNHGEKILVILGKTMERIISAMNVSCRKAKKLLGHWGVLFLLIPPSHSVPESVTATVYYYYQRYQRIAGIPQQTICCWIYILKITEYHTLVCIFHYYNVDIVRYLYFSQNLANMFPSFPIVPFTNAHPRGTSIPGSHSYRDVEGPWEVVVAICELRKNPNCIEDSKDKLGGRNYLDV